MIEFKNLKLGDMFELLYHPMGGKIFYQIYEIGVVVKITKKEFHIRWNKNGLTKWKRNMKDFHIYYPNDIINYIPLRDVDE